MVLTKTQEQGLKIALEKYKNNEAYVTIAGYAGTGKAQPVDTIIPTPDGDKRLGDIKEGDYVFDAHGQPTKVLKVFPQGAIDNYKVTLGDGRVTYCNEEHLWGCYENNRYWVYTLKEIINKGVKKNHQNRFYVPNLTNPVVYNQKTELSIDSYAMGVYLAAGMGTEDSFSLKHIFNTADVLSSLEDILEAKPLDTIGKMLYTKDNIPIKTKEILKDFPELWGEHNKIRIPDVYKKASIEDRYKLLQGLMDVNGRINVCGTGTTFNFFYTDTNLDLIKDIQEVFRSLYYTNSKITYDENHKKYILKVYLLNKEKIKFFRNHKGKVQISTKAIDVHKREDFTKSPIVSVEKMDEPAEMVCIYVDNEEHLYLTNDFIVTHNTTLVKTLIQSLPNVDPSHDVCYCAFTGKACQVLTNMGNKPTCTLHRLLFEYRPKPDGGFVRIPRPTLDYKVIVVDECSMLPQSFVDMLLSYPVFIIFIGDPFQLKPISSSKEDNSNYLLNNPDVFLSEIMRQAADNDIINLSMKIRNGDYIHPYNGKNVKVFKKADLNTGMLEWADIIICATNKKRHELNQQIRELKGFSGPPQNGEKIICLQNNWEKFSVNGEPLVNGLVGYLNNSYTSFNPIPAFFHSSVGKIDTVVGNFVSETGEDYGQLTMDKKRFDTEEETLDGKMLYRLGKSKYKYLIPEQFTYGYAVSCHKAQGDSWGKVLVIEENFPFDREEHQRWSYTACTRSTDKLVYIKNI